MNRILAVCAGVVSAFCVAPAHADPPQLTVASPQDGFVTNAASVPVSGTAFASAGAEPITVTVNSVPVPVAGDGTFGGSVILSEWGNAITVLAEDGLGQVSAVYLNVEQDLLPPNVWFFGAEEGQVLNTDELTPSCGASDDFMGSAQATLNGLPFTCGDTIRGFGTYTFAIDATDQAGNSAHLSVSFALALPPQVIVTTPAGGLITNVQAFPVQGTATASPGAGPVTVTINGTSVSVGAGGSFSGVAQLQEGWQVVVVEATDAFGQTTTILPQVVLDTVPPEVYLQLEEGWVTAEAFAPLCGAGDSNLAWVQATLDGQPFSCGDVVSAEGDHTLSLVAMDFGGNTSQVTRTFAIDRTPPQITVSGVADGAFVLAPVSVQVTSTDAHPLATTVILDGVGMDETFTLTTPGTHTLLVQSTDLFWNSAATELVFTIAPADLVAQIVSPAPATVTNQPQADVAVRVTGTYAIDHVTASGVAMVLQSDGLYHAVLSLVEGSNEIQVIAVDAIGTQASQIVCLTLDTAPPTVQISQPGEGNFACQGTTVHIVGNASDAHGIARVTVAGSPVTVDCAGAFSADVALHPGSNTIAVVATDDAGNQATTSLTTSCAADGNQSPVVSAGSDQTISLPSTPPVPALQLQALAQASGWSSVAATSAGWLVSNGTQLLAISSAGVVSTFATVTTDRAIVVAVDGTVYAGNGSSIARISANGSNVEPSWVSISASGATLSPGGLAIAPDGALTAITSSGTVWNIAPAGTRTLVAESGLSLVGAARIPVSAGFGPLSGKVVSVSSGGVVAIGADGAVTTYAVRVTSPAGLSWVPEVGRLGALSTAGTLSISDASSISGHLVLAEAGGALYKIAWTGTGLQVNRIATGAGWASIAVADDGPAPSPNASTSLSGSASDDGLPNPPAALTLLWSAAGPAPVSFVNPTLATTTATFANAGSYTLTLTGSDSALSSSGETHVQVLPGNHAPVVNAGPDQFGVVDFPVALSGSATDDGLPGLSPLSTAWSVLSGPGTVDLAASALTTNATFHTTGDYVLRLTANDGDFTTTSDLLITVVASQEPLLSAAVSAPSTYRPGSTVAAQVQIANSGAAPAVQIAVSGTLNGSAATATHAQLDAVSNFTLPLSFSTAGTPAPGSSGSAYVAALLAMAGTKTIHAVGTYRNGAGNPYSFAAPDTTIEQLLPVVSTTLAPQTLTSVAPGDVVPISVALQNIGNDNANAVRIGVAQDLTTAANPPPLVPDWTAAGFVPTDLAVGSSANPQVSFAVPALAPRGPQETSSAYANRLVAAQQGIARFDFFTAWDDDLGGAYGASRTELTAPVKLPILSAGNPSPTVVAGTATSSELGWLTSIGGAPVASATVVANTHDGSHLTITTGPIASGPMFRATKLWTPISPAQRAPAETSSQYVARLTQFAGSHPVPAQATWTSSGGATFGPIDYTLNLTMLVPLVSLSSATPPRDPGGNLNLYFSTPYVATLLPTITLPNGQVVSGVLSGISSVRAYNFPSVGPVPDLKGATESDDDYVARLVAWQQVVRNYPWSATWTDVAGNPYGPIDGVVSGAELLPIAVPSISCPQQAAAGQTVTCTVQIHDVGTNRADAEVTALFPDGKTQTLSAGTNYSLVVAFPGGTSSIAYSYTVPADQPSSWMELGARVRWSSQALDPWYGPLTVKTRMHVGENLRPLVDGGRSQTVSLAAGADLHGVVADDGLVFGHQLTSVWTQISGPGWVGFQDSANPTTHAQFSETGDYVLQLAANDGQYVTNSRVTILVRANEAPANQPPLVSGGAPQTVSLPAVLATSPQPKFVGSYPGVNTIAAHEALGSLLVSVNDPVGEPYNLALLQPDGTLEQFSSLHGVTGELSIAVAEEDDGGTITIGGFATGAVFTAGHNPGEVVRISADGSTIDDPWITLPGETRYLAGGMIIDRTGLFGGDLLVVTDTGSIWRVSAQGAATRIVALNLAPAFGSNPVEDVEVFPNDPVHYGPLAGKLVLTTNPYASDFWLIDPSGLATSHAWAEIASQAIRGVENIRIVRPNQNLFGVRIPTEMSYVQNRTMFVIPASGMLSMAGDIVLDTEDYNDTIAQEVGALYRLHWTGTRFQVNQINVPFMPAQAFEGLAFARAGAAREAPLSVTLQLAGATTDDGLPAPVQLVSSWSKLSGPGAVSFADVHNPQSTATFSDPGKYVLRLSATDGALSAASDVAIFINPADQPPVVNAGADQSIVFGSSASLAGTASDDGIPVGAALTCTWSKAGGPGAVTFSAPDALQTTASFSAPGTYQLRLAVSDSEMVGTSDLMVRVVPPNAPPAVYAGSDQTIVLPSLTARLSGTASDDGLPDGHLQTTWSQLSGPATAVFSDVNSRASLVTVPQAGDYVLRLSATDDDLTSTSSVTVHFVPPSSINRAPVVSAGADRVVGDLTLQLAGAVADDGLPAGSVVTAQWTQVSGATVTFSEPSQLRTLVTFPGGGAYVLRLTASDGELASHADVQITVFAEPPTNNPPSVRVTGPIRFPIGAGAVQFVGDATDDGLPAGLLTYSWSTVSGPAAVVFDSPSASSSIAHFLSAGDYVLRLTVSDGDLASGADLVVIVDPPNQPPIVLAGASQTVTMPALTATLQGQVYDDGLPLDGGLTWRWSGPRGVSFAEPEHVSTTATFPGPGIYPLTLTASDSQLTAAAQTVVTVVSDNTAPVANAGPDQTIVLPTRSALLAGSVTDDGKPAGGSGWSRWTQLSGPPATLADVRALQTTASLSDPGIYVFRLTASDGELQSSDTLQVTLAPPAGVLPVVVLTSPDDGSALSAPTLVQGTVDSGAWALEYARDGASDQPSWVAFASGVGSASGVLGIFDPTVLLNGSYVIRLSSTSQGGSASAQLGVVVQKNLKIGNVALAFTDAAVAAGLPISIVRAYDSRDTSSGEFGAGWNLSMRNVRVEKTAVTGKFWQETQEGYFAFPSYCLKPTRANQVSVTFPNGKVYRFAVQASPQCQPLMPIDSPQISLTPLPGTVGQLAIADAQPTAFVRLDGGIPGPVQLTDTDGFALYDPKEFQLTTEDGTIYLVRQYVGVEAITDRNGNTITISPEGIRSSSGVGTSFLRDGAGRITQISDPNGHSLFYDYDQDGNLVHFTDRAGSVTSFAYDGFHRLLSITDARGKQVLSESYDAAGRLASSSDSANHAVLFTHDLAAHKEIVTDALGHPTTYEYDSDGNVVRVIDALGQESFASFDDNDNKLSETDALGHATSWTYDASNNKTSETDPLGHKTLWTYDQFGNVLSVEDPLHHLTSNVRESGIVCGHAGPSGNLLSTTDAKGNTTSYAYDCSGKLLSQKDARGAVTTYTYESTGLLSSSTDALGHTTTYDYDANGNQKSETRSRIVNGLVEALVTSSEYDDAGRRTRVTSPDGSFTRTEYNEIGKPESTFDQLGRKTQYAYDDQGRLSTTTYPDQTTSVTSYDENGRQKTSKDRAGRTTSFAYDELGRLKTTTYPDTTFRTTEYDEVGRVHRSLDELGHPTIYGYDDAGRRTSVTDPLSKSTVFAYDEAGNQLSVTDANQSTVFYGYDELNRQTTVTYPDTTYETTRYDAQGNRKARIDQANIRTEYGYDLLGRLTSVTNKNVNGTDLVTRYDYDELGNRISQTDANGHTTRFAYDQLGRRISRTLPLGQVESFSYYADGQLHTRTDFNGHSTSYVYDDAGRLTTRTPDASFASEVPVSFTYWPSGRRKTMADLTGTTSYSYDSRDRLLTKSTPEGSLTYTYDVAGNRKTVQSDSGAYDVGYGYDALNRLTSVTDNVGSGGTTGYHYDDGGRLSSYDYPNTISTAFVYDALNRVQSIKIGSALGTANENLVASYGYTFYPTGNRHTVAELSGRGVTWAYDNLWRLTNETIAGSAVSGSIGYVYDNVGNRLSRSSSVGGIANQTSTYDNDDRLLADGWDPNGNTLSSNGSQYGYDSENRLLSLNASQAHYVYDGDGQLVSKTAGGVTTTYLIDSENPTGYTQIAEERVGGVAQKSYVYGPQRITMRDGSGLHYYGYDAHSGVRLLLDGSGNVTDTWDYDAFGNVVARTGSTANSFTYRGEQMDSALGLEYLRARWMDPAKGRFATRDPWQGTLQQPSSLNQFMYATDDPLLHPDPAGLCDCTLPSVTIAAGVQQILVSVAVSALAIKAVSDARDIAGQRTDYRDVYWRGLTSFDLEDLSLSRGKVIWSWASRMLMDKAAAWALALAPSSAQRHYTDPALVGSDGSPFVGVTKGKQLARAKAQRYGTNLIVEFRTDRKPLWTPADPLGNDFESESLFFWDIGGGPNDLLWGPY